jgi:hypothetical protein
MNMTTATVYEMGNGFPGVDDYVPGDDGELYRITATDGRISTTGMANNITAELELADWDDVEENDIFPARAVLETETT